MILSGDQSKRRIALKALSTQAYFKSKKTNGALDSGCARRMPGNNQNQCFFVSLSKTVDKLLVNVTWVCNSLELRIFLLVDGLKHNLFSISDLRDKGNKVVFESNICSIQSAKR